MLAFPVEPDLSFPLMWRTVDMFKAYSEAPELEHIYRVETNGLKPQVKGATFIPANLHMAQGEFGFQSATYCGVSETTCFLDLLKRYGATSFFERREEGLGFCFWFDVSTRTRQAYYELSHIIWHGESSRMPGIAYTYCALVLCRDLNAEVVSRVRALDEALYTVAKICGVPRCAV